MLYDYYLELEKINCYVSPECIISPKATILFNTIILGNSVVDDGAVIGPNTVIISSKVLKDAQVISSYVVNSIIGEKSMVGPFSHIRENTTVGKECRIGNFVEIKKSKLGDKTKASHLAYIGDSEIGVNCNFGCGSITVNYDGVNKHKTVIGDDVFIGCNTNLVAPVTIHNKSFTACGSTITADVPENTLAIARSRQLNKIDYYK